MMPIRSKTNLYAGINPHLNSALQQKGGDWRSFHSYHIIHIAEYLNQHLPDAYVAKPEKSLQIGTYDGESLPIRASSPQADILISREESPITGQTPDTMQTDTPVLTLPMSLYVDSDEEFDSLVIYHERSGEAVTRLELLSPANMPKGSHYGEYLRKRYQTLKSGVRLVEIDYLHKNDPITDQIPNYQQGDVNANPYHIIVSDPRPTFEDGKTDVYSFGVLDKLPTIDIPLDGDDIVIVVFSTIYNKTYTERPFWRTVDYSEEPLHMENFNADDQQAIRDMMSKIQPTTP